MLGTGHDLAPAGKALGLKAAHTCTSHRRAKERVFARTFRDASPTGIAADVDHRGKDPVGAAGSSLARSDTRRLLHKVGIPRARLCKGNGKDSPVAVDHVIAHDQWDAQPRLFHGDALQAVDLTDGANAQERTYLPLTNSFLQAAAVPWISLHHLTHLLFQGHLRKQRLGARFDLRIRLCEPNVAL